MFCSLAQPRARLADSFYDPSLKRLQLFFTQCPVLRLERRAQ
jgi:hypothetical protein